MLSLPRTWPGLWFIRWTTTSGVISNGSSATYLFGIHSERQLVREIQVNAAYRRPNHRDGYFYKREYAYDRERDVYVCPNGQALNYRTTNRQGYREYASTPNQCTDCAMKGQCTRSANEVKVVIRHVWEDHKEAVNAHRLSPTGKRLYKRRKETVERSFADAKELHGHRYARYRGVAKVRGQALLAGACQNMKKMARLLARAAARLLHVIRPIQDASGRLQARLRDLLASFLFQAAIRQA